MSKTPSQLDHLPQEIITAILENVSSPSSLANVARVCRRLQSPAETLLYRSVDLRNHDGESFTYAVNRKASRARHVQDLTIHYHYESDIPNEQDYYPVLGESMVPTIARLANLRRLVVKGLDYDVDRDYDDGDIGRAPRLAAWSEAWNSLFEQSTQNMSTVLSSLTTCELILNDLTPVDDIYAQDWHFSACQTILLHRRLQNLTIVAALITGLSKPAFAQARPRSTALETLTLLCCDIHPNALRQMLKLPASLKTLTLRGAPWTTRPDHFPTNRAAIVDAIKAQADSLHSLELDFYLSTEDPALDFRDFKHLQQLTIHPAVLRGEKSLDTPEGKAHILKTCHLPPSIRHLQFREHQEKYGLDLNTLPIIHSWITLKELPNLEKITVQSAQWRSDTVLDAPFTEGRSFQEAFQDTGVELEFETVPESEHVVVDCWCCSCYWRFREWQI
ncbi:hypothetical protein BDV25DRAFT_171170 [Aspergillus avenaceus]|uniref:F-box domain-containing protein n=1 Tax=Aspergillus avenaceus TaxID=36643 RepID=A0A5N6TF46_ASPAV|nr:hypothetical protein BDV25DRAFT_171170 [Aspergillus avenaceus]